MRKFLALSAALVVAIYATGCSPSGEEIADRVNPKMVEKIKKGDVKTADEMNNVVEGLLPDVYRDMGIDPDKLSEDVKKARDNKLDEYKKDWLKLIKEEPWKKK